MQKQHFYAKNIMDKILNSNINVSKSPTHFRRTKFNSTALLALKVSAYRHNSLCNSETTSSYHTVSLLIAFLCADNVVS